MEDWINRLFDRVIKLRYNSKLRNPDKSEKELNKCISLMNRIIEEGRHQKISVNRLYFDDMIKIQDIFEEINFNINNKRNTYWNRIKMELLKAINLVSTFLGYGNLVNLLTGNKPKLLE